ncbi:MAG: FixH family protein [Syntrophales bacterium]|nr:FixH family protein [Syntrophales bacterium]
MKRRAWLVVLLVVLVAGTAFAKEYVVQKKAGDYTVDIKMDKDPPVAGMNHVEVMIRDKAGKVLKDAKVLIAASMPAMPGMQPITSTAEAKLSGDKYIAMIEIPSAGTWNMSVGIGQGGKTATAKWTVDAR